MEQGAKNSNCEFRNANCPPRRMNSTRNGNSGLLGTDLAAFREYAERPARSIHPRVGSPGSAAALRGNTRRSVALSIIQAARAHFHSRSPFGTRRSASGESRHEWKRRFCRRCSALPDLPFANGQTQSASRIASRPRILGLPKLSRLWRHAPCLTGVSGPAFSKATGVLP